MSSAAKAEGRYLSGVGTISVWTQPQSTTKKKSRLWYSQPFLCVVVRVKVFPKDSSQVDHPVKTFWVQILVVTHMDQQGQTLSDPARGF